jgi:RHS repeat-associated protein
MLIKAPSTYTRFDKHRTASRPTASSAAKPAVLQVLADIQRTERQRRRVGRTNGRIEWVQQCDQTRCEYGYDQRGDLARIREPNGRCTRYDYDEQRRLILVRDADGRRTCYRYGAGNRLAATEKSGGVTRFYYDHQGRLTRRQCGDAGSSVYRHDTCGRLRQARTDRVSCEYAFDENNQLTALSQTLNGITLTVRLSYDSKGRLARMRLPGSTAPIRYQWDKRGGLASVGIGQRPLATFTHTDTDKTLRIGLANGVGDHIVIGRTSHRPRAYTVTLDGQCLLDQQYTYNSSGRIVSDGQRRYAYDALGRLAGVEDLAGPRRWEFDFDQMGNRTLAHGPGDSRRFVYDSDDRLLAVEQDNKVRTRFAYDGSGRLSLRASPGGQRSYRYDDAGRLTAVYFRGDRLVTFTYDHKGRLVSADHPDRTERFLYGPADELLAVTDGHGRPIRLYIMTPMGYLAEVHGGLDSGAVYFHHNDIHGTTRLITDTNGNTAACFDYGPFGEPLWQETRFVPMLTGHLWHGVIGHYYFGARWYDPGLARFLTPDTYTGGPDDERLVNPHGRSADQAHYRDRYLNDWLTQPAVRNRYIYCGNDPINRVDPSGHWSFLNILLSIAGALWNLSNTALGLLVEVSNIIGEIIRWLVYGVSGGTVSWQHPWSADAAASEHLSAFALVFRGGWLGSLLELKPVTFGNIFFVSDQWEQHPFFREGGNVQPWAYAGDVTLPRNRALYEYALWFTNNLWLGPFFYLVYAFDLAISSPGYGYSSFQRRAYARSALGPDKKETLYTDTYGGYELRRGDHDLDPLRPARGQRYAGAARNLPDKLPQGRELPFVESLQRDLAELRFNIVGNPDGHFGRKTYWAVREFQSYAKMDSVAKEDGPGNLPYIDRLSRVKNGRKYFGPVSGVVNAFTRDTIQYWKDNNLRCPVVIQAWDMQNGNRNRLHPRGGENIWLHTDVRNTNVRMFVRDFSGHYELDPKRDPDEFFTVGEYSIYEYIHRDAAIVILWRNTLWEGMRLIPPLASWREGEVLPQHLIGESVDDLGDSRRSTFKVIRAVSEIESLAFCDGLNVHHSAVLPNNVALSAFVSRLISSGLFNWTLGIDMGPRPGRNRSTVSPSELGSLLSYFRSFNNDAYEKAFGIFGIDAENKWRNDDEIPGAQLFNPEDLTYQSWIVYQQDNGSYRPVDTALAEADYFRTWHWFYRFAMAARTVDSWKQVMWDMARIRIRDLLLVPWPANANVPQVAGPDGPRPATIGDIYTSELALSFLLRWHVWTPSHIIYHGFAGRGLTSAFERARANLANANASPTTWANADEQFLIDGLRDQVFAEVAGGDWDTPGRNFRPTFYQLGWTQFERWPEWSPRPPNPNANPFGYQLDPDALDPGGRQLRTGRGSFNLDESGLPQTPFGVPRAAPARPPDADIREEAIRNLRYLQEFYYETIINGARIILPPPAWQNARENRLDIKTTLLGLIPRSYRFVYDMIQQFDLSYIRFSSLYRPNWPNPPHNDGRGLDITHLYGRNGDYVWFNRQVVNQPVEPQLARNVRIWAWGHQDANGNNNVTQVVGPWFHRGVVGQPPGWQINDFNTPVEQIHIHHLHITIRR